MQLYTKILIGLIGGAVVGAIANLAGITVLQNILGEMEILGTAFINLITMIVIPLVVASLLVGTASLGDLSKLGRIGGKTLAYYMLTTAVAVTIGLALANVIKPGSGLSDAASCIRRCRPAMRQAAWRSPTTPPPGRRPCCGSFRAIRSAPRRTWTCCL